MTEVRLPVSIEYFTFDGTTESAEEIRVRFETYLGKKYPGDNSPPEVTASLVSQVKIDADTSLPTLQLDTRRSRLVRIEVGCTVVFETYPSVPTLHSESYNEWFLIDKKKSEEFFAFVKKNKIKTNLVDNSDFVISITNPQVFTVNDDYLRTCISNADINDVSIREAEVSDKYVVDVVFDTPDQEVKRVVSDTEIEAEWHSGYVHIFNEEETLLIVNDRRVLYIQFI